MERYNSLLACAEQEGIDVDWFHMNQAESLSLALGKDSYAIAIDPSKIRSRADLTHKLAHEIGHCMTGSFYNCYSDFDCRQKHENTADRWAIHKLVPKDALDEAVSLGCRTLWELADYFDITEDLMAKAVCLHTHGNLAVSHYLPGTR